MAADPDEPADNPGPGGGPSGLDEVAEFCAGPQPYLWLQGEPWGAAATLLATFAAKPPAGIDVVTFVVTASLASEADSNAFTESLIRQLSPLAAETLSAPVTSAAGHEAYRAALLYEAARRCDNAGRRLVLTVVGIDDDKSSASGLASIASLLPGVPPPGLRVIITSRPHAQLPGDLARDHPLRTCPPRIVPTTPPGPGERGLSEIDPGLRTAIGLVAAAGGGLGLADLLTLTGLPRSRLEALLAAATGDTLSIRVPRDTPVYVLAPNLHAEVVAWLGDGELSGYRGRVHAWADSYCDRGWPAVTPDYLLRTYPVMLRDTADTARLVRLATDPARHRRLRHHTGADAAALNEIPAAQTLVLRQRDPDLAALARLCVRRTAIGAAHLHVPRMLPAAWATAGRIPRAEAIADSLANVTDRTVLLAALVPVVAASGDHARARTIADAIPCPGDRARALATLVRLVAAAGDTGQAAAVAGAAEAVVGTVPDAGSRTWAAITLMSAIAALGDYDRAAALIRMVEAPYEQVLAWGQLVSAVPAGDPHAAVWVATAGATAQRIDDANSQTAALNKLLPALRGHGQPGRAAELATRARAVALSIPDTGLRAINLADLASAVVATGDSDRAAELVIEVEALARDITRAVSRARVLTGLVPVAAAIGDAHWAARLATAADAVIRTVGHPTEQDYLWKHLVAKVAAAGDPDRARAIADAIPLPMTRVLTVAGLASTAVATGDTDRALALIAAADQLAHAMPNPGSRIMALTELVPVLTEAGDDRRVDAAIATVEVDASAIVWPEGRDLRLAELVKVVGVAREDRAAAIAGTIANPRHRAGALATLAVEVGAAGNAERAAELAHAAETAAQAVGDPESYVWGLVTLVAALASAGDAGQAAVIAGLANEAVLALPDPYLQEHIQTQLASAPDGPRDWHREAMTAPMDEASARRVVAEALAAKPWKEALSLVAAHTPATLSAIAGALNDEARNDEGTAARRGRP